MLLAVAESFTVVFAVTELVSTMNVFDVFPAGMVIATGVGTTVVSFEVKVTVMFPGAAALSSVTVPVTMFPPLIVLGLSTRDLTPMGLTVRFARLVLPLSVAVM